MKQAIWCTKGNDTAHLYESKLFMKGRVLLKYACEAVCMDIKRRRTANVLLTTVTSVQLNEVILRIPLFIND